MDLRALMPFACSLLLFNPLHAQRAATTTLDGDSALYGDAEMYGNMGVNTSPTPWGDGSGTGSGSELDNLRVTNANGSLQIFAGGNLAVGQTAMVFGIRRDGFPSVTAFPGVDGGNGFFQAQASGPGLGGFTLPPTTLLVMVRKPSPGLLEVAYVDAVTSGPVLTQTASHLHSGELVNINTLGLSVALNNGNLGGVNATGAVSPESVTQGVELRLWLANLDGGVSFPSVGEKIQVFALVTSYDGELGSNQTLPMSSIVGTPANPDINAALLGTVAEHTLLAEESFPIISTLYDPLEWRTLRTAAPDVRSIRFENRGMVGTQLTALPSIPGIPFTATLPINLPALGSATISATPDTSTAGVTEILPSAFVFSGASLEYPSMIRSIVGAVPDGIADDAGYITLGTSAGIHSAGTSGMKTLLGKVEGDALWLAATGALNINESIILFIDSDLSQGLPVGTPLPGGAFTPSVFNQIVGTILDHEADAAVRVTRTGASTVGFSFLRFAEAGVNFEGGYTDSVPSDGTPTIASGQTVAHAFRTVPNLASVANEGFEVRLNLTDLAMSGGITVSGIMTTQGAYNWSSDIIPPIYQQGAGQIGHSPDLRALAGYQAARLSGPTAPEMELAQGSIGFQNNGAFTMPRAGAGQPGTVRTFSVVNGGSAPLDVAGVSLHGDPVFTLENTSPTLPLTLPPGAAYTFDIRLSGAVPGTYSRQLRVLTNDADETLFRLNLTGVIADTNPDVFVEVGPDQLMPGETLDFGLLQEGLRDRTRRIRATNIGGLPLNVTSIGLASGARFSIAGITPALPVTLPSDGFVEVDVTLAETEVGATSDTLTIASNDPDASAFAINLRGQVSGSRTALYGTASINGDVEGDDLPYGYPIESQKLRTGFGDGAGSLIGGAGSELNDLYVTNDSDNLYVMIPGNLESNGNLFLLFIDRVADTTGASTTLPAMAALPFLGSTHVDNTPLPANINVDLALGMSLRFESSFVRTTFYHGDVNTLAAGTMPIQHGPLPLNAAIHAPATGYAWAIDGRNTAGVEFGNGGFTTRPPFTATKGIEIRIPFSVLEGAVGPVARGEEFRMFAAIDNATATFWSNQFLPSLDISAGNLASSINLSPAGVNLRVASHRVLSPPEPVTVGAGQQLTFNVGPGTTLTVEDFDVLTPGTLYVVRHREDSNRAGLDPAFLLNEYWSLIATDGLTFGTARLVFPYDEASLAGVPESAITTVHKVEGSTLIASYPVTSVDTVANTVTVDVPGPTFSDWFIGLSTPSAVPEWHLLE